MDDPGTKKPKLTKAQVALCKILACDRFEIFDLIGHNHPTAKWFARESGIPMEADSSCNRKRQIMAFRLLER